MTASSALNDTVIAERLAFLTEAADESARVILPYFRDNVAVDHKEGQGVFDPVTVADRAGEQRIREMIKARYPEDSIFGEEFGREEGTSDFRWVLDPIDGTRSFISGIPLWGTLIGLNHKSQALMGAMNQPYIGELFIGSPLGSFVRRNGESKPLKTRHCPKLEDALTGTTAPEIFTKPDDVAAFERLKKTVKLVRYGGDCYLYCMVAAGQLDLVVEVGLNAYDIAALVPIIEGAGGVITSWEGGSASDGGRVVAAGCPELHEAALKVLQSQS